ncbi:MAG: hypothetical protein PHP59_09810 [Methanofollis sp.]|uniref:hypothetical protein n=1 Tax=Methanofollis sp. TaxID=2052835 RepID=UPI0026227E67|nr:hypothetical protein [Methanofollis sp.]MDD4255653.1 hypothetical protein [Methanofollis sp.]
MVLDIGLDALILFECWILLVEPVEGVGIRGLDGQRLIAVDDFDKHDRRFLGMFCSLVVQVEEFLLACFDRDDAHIPVCPIPAMFPPINPAMFFNECPDGFVFLGIRMNAVQDQGLVSLTGKRCLHRRRYRNGKEEYRKQNPDDQERIPCSNFSSHILTPLRKRHL